MFIDLREDWFETEEFWERYRPLMFDPDRMADTEEEADGIAVLAGLKSGSRILDLCCGEGRHDLVFAERGYSVTGVDITKPYLKRARAAADKAGLEVEYVEQDVRSFKRPESYDFALNFFTSFGYFDDEEDDLQMCRNVCESLVPGGQFLIDTIGKETTALHFKNSEWFQRDGYHIMLQYRITDGWTHLENRWIFVSDSHEQPSELNEIIFRHRLYSAKEMALMLAEAGFSEVRFFGALDGRPYDHKAQRMLVLAVR